MDSSHSFQPGQIVGLDYQNCCLYAEVIQVVNSRQLCWVRPLILLEYLSDGNIVDSQSLQSLQDSANLSDLRESSDLIWPIQLFRAALDTEVIPLLVHLEALEGKTTITQTAHQQLQGFVRQVWQAYPEVFQE